MNVDNCLSGADDVEATVKLQQSLDKMMERGGFNLTKWVSNSREVLGHIAEQEQAEASTVDFNASEPLKPLGICWNTLTDCFLFSVSSSMLAVSDPETKRSLFSIASRVFDPMGLITPFTIRAKMLFQELWQRGLQWEDRLDEDIADQWRSWKSELSQLCCITIPRYFMGNIQSSSSIELHGFGDASPAAYGAAVYIKCVGEAGQLFLSVYSRHTYSAIISNHYVNHMTLKILAHSSLSVRARIRCGRTSRPPVRLDL